MTEPMYYIPRERLPPGFADKLDAPLEKVAEPSPAATVVLLRDSQEGLQALLLKRHRASGFVPGAYVFPGGRADEHDTNVALIEGARIPERGNVPAHFWFAALRELFEETGVLLAHTSDGEWAPAASASERLEQWRLKLMNNQARLIDLVQQEKLQLVLDDVVYFAHWITPIAEPRRYDTRFFAAALPAGRVAKADAREMVDAVWLTPAQALERFRAGLLPMVFPTVRTLQDLVRFHSVEEAFEQLRQTRVQPILPRLVRSHGGVGIVID